MNTWKMTVGAVIATGLALAAGSYDANAMMKKARADLINPEGKGVGSVELLETPNGVLLTAKLKNLPAGTHAFHVHSVGKCEAPFKSAGGHFNPGKDDHGILSDDGLHAGDMPNVHVSESGALTIEILNDEISLEKDESETVFDADGSAIVMHMKGDDYKSQPSGAAGARIACGVIK